MILHLWSVTNSGDVCQMILEQKQDLLSNEPLHALFNYQSRHHCLLLHVQGHQSLYYVCGKAFLECILE